MTSIQFTKITKPSQVSSGQGWRRTGIINVSLAFACGLSLVICLAISLSQPGSSLSKAHIIFDGSCSKSQNTNLMLHVLLNLISSLILASSNFFMQVLNSPSRQEIDQAHGWLRSLDIGIPSIKNLRHVSWFKRISWLIFLISSVPLHLFFNSTIFETNYSASRWNLTIATEAFTQGALYFPPGASLTPAGAGFPPWDQNRTIMDHSANRITTNSYPWFSLGQSVESNDYWNALSPIRQNISSIANEAHSWIMLDSKDCQAEYISCNPRKEYGDVVIIVEGSATNSTGWTRSEICNHDLSSNLSSYWDTPIPAEGINSLWFSTQCSIIREVPDFVAYDHMCEYNCSSAVGLPSNPLPLSKFPPLQESWHLGFSSPWLEDSISPLQVRYCLAQPIQEHCKIGVSNALLLVVITCVFIKAIQGIIVVWKLSNASLVTLGDAMESFISNPDPRTEGLGTLDILDSEQLEVSAKTPRQTSIDIPTR